MKRTMHLHITDPINFAKGDWEYALSLYNGKMSIDDWVYVGPAKVEVPDEAVTEALQMAMKELDAKEKEVRDELSAKLAVIERTRQELLALPAPSAPPKVEGDGTG